MGSGLALLPLSIAILLPLTFIITYVWSVVQGHVEPDFPYISSTGTYPPESCFFGQMLNIIALMVGVTVWVRHMYVVDYCAKNVTSKKLPFRSKVSSVLGYTAAAGISLVGNFQATNVGSIHVLGAFLAFGIGNLYMWVQSVMSYNLEPHVNSRLVSRVRIVSSFTATIMNILTVLFSFLHSLSNKYVVVYFARDHSWQVDRNHWEYHVIATATEWVLAGCFCVVFLTLIPEFKRVTVQGTTVELDRDRRQTRTLDFTQSTDTIIASVRL